MDFFVCAYGEPGEERFIPDLAPYIDGIEIQNYDRRGVISETVWHEVLAEHRRLRSLLPGRLAVHGPFVGLDYTYKDHLLREAVRKRLDMTFEMVCILRPDTLVLHSGCPEQMVRFGLIDTWLDQATSFWKVEIKRYEKIGVRVVLENIVESTPELLIRLVDAVGSNFLGICFDIGHATLCSQLPPSHWVERIGSRLYHVHLHDNNGQTDEHLPVGSGIIDFDAFFAALKRWAPPQTTISLEIIAEPHIVVDNALEVIRRYR